MNELIKITETNGKSVVSARELHQFLEAGSNVSTWFKNQAERAMLIDGEDFIQIFEESTGGRPSTDYAIALNSAKELAMLNGGEKGKQARLYFIECEKQLQLQAPKTFREALLLAAKLEEEKELLQLQVNNLDQVLDNLLDLVSIIKIAQHNKVKETAFNWRVLANASKVLGYEIKKAQSPRFGYQNLYHVDAFKRCYPQFNYDIKN